MKLTLVVNPMASAVTPKTRTRAEEVLGDGNDLTVAETLYRGHATDLAREAASRGSQAVAVLGGDGTLNEAANGLVGSECALAPLPGGSTNVFCRTVGFSKKLKKAIPEVHAALQKPPRRIGLGLVNGRYFTFHVGVGYDAAVVAKVEKKPHLKRKIGQAVFVYASLATWSRGYDRKHPHFTVRVGDDTVVEDGYFAICLNSNPYTYLGVRPLNAARGDASLDQPLVLVTLRTLKLFKFLPLIGSTLGSGEKLKNSPWVDYRPDLHAVTLTATPETQQFPYQADGDYLGASGRLTITYEPDRLLLITP